MHNKIDTNFSDSVEVRVISPRKIKKNIGAKWSLSKIITALNWGTVFGTVWSHWESCAEGQRQTTAVENKMKMTVLKYTVPRK